MRLNFINRKTDKSFVVDFDRFSLIKIKQMALAAAKSNSKYFMCLIAESSDEIDFISTHFANVPLPDITAKKAAWTGEMATFIIMNFPLEGIIRAPKED